MQASQVRSLLILFLLFQLASCNCKKKTNTCPALNSTYKSYVSLNIGDTIKFVNDFGVQTNFVIRKKSISEASEHQCHVSSDGICICPDCDIQGSYAAFTNDNLWTKFDTIDNEAKNYGHLYYTIFQFINNEQDYSKLLFAGLEFQFEYPVKPENLGGNQRIIADTNLGSHQYQNVIVCTVDTSSSWYRNKENFYTKLYFKPEIGVIGFHHVKLNATFYLP